MTVHLEKSRTVPVPPQAAYDTVLPHPLPEIFADRSWAIPPIKEVRDQPPTWDTVGQTRTIVLADGGTLREELTSVTPGQSFGYVISDVTGPMKALVAKASGLWSFTPEGAGTRITWAWDVEPKGALGRAAMPLFGYMWRGSADKALIRIEQIIVR